MLGKTTPRGDSFPAAATALHPENWAEITAEGRLFSESAEERFDAVRRHIVQMEPAAEAGTGTLVSHEGHASSTDCSEEYYIVHESDRRCRVVVYLQTKKRNPGI
jgi:hypothetical protein